MRLLRRTAGPIILGLLILVSSATGADLFLVREKGTTKLVFTAKKKLSYTFSEPSAGVAILKIEGVRLRSRRPIKVKDRVIKRITITQKGTSSVVKLTLDPKYHVKLQESYPPFRLTLTPEPLTPELMMERMLTSLYRRGDCDTFLANAGRLNLRTLPPDKLNRFVEMQANCTLKTENPLLVLETYGRIAKILKEPVLEKVRAKKVEALLKLKRYEEALAEGKLFIQKYKDYTADLVASYMAEALIKLDRKDDAIIVLKNLIKAHPDSPYIDHMYKELAKAYYLKDNFLGAYLLLKRAYDDNPKLVEADGEALFMYGSSAYRVGLKEEARRVLLRVLNLHPNTPEAAKALGLLGRIYADRKDWKTAEWFYKLCMRLYPNTKAAAVARIRLAEHYEELGEYRKALNLYTEAEILYPHMPDVLEVALYRKGVMMLKLGRYEEAIQAFKDFMLKVPQSSFLQEAERYIEEAEFRIAEKKYREGRLEDAVKLLTQFAKRYPQNPHTPEAIKLAGKALVRIVEDKFTRGDCAGILLFWDLYKNFFPQKAQKSVPLFHIAQCMLSKGRKAEAVNLMVWIEKNIGNSFPKWKSLLTYLTNYYFEIENYKLAEETALKLIKITTAREAPYVHHQLVRLLLAQNRYKEMDSIIQKMEKEKAPPRYLAYNHFARAIALLDIGKRTEGVKELEKFTESRVSLLNYPNRYQLATILLARIYYNDHQRNRAYSRYLWYANAFPNGRYTPEALFMLGLIMKNPKDRQFWYICLKRFPNSHWSKEIKAHLLAKEILDEARKAAGVRSTKGST